MLFRSDFETVDDAAEKVLEELSEVKAACAGDDENAKTEEIGDLLFSVVNVARLAGVDSEKALYDACEKFLKRFSKMEKAAAEQGTDLDKLSLLELESLWEKAKK